MSGQHPQHQQHLQQQQQPQQHEQQDQREDHLVEIELVEHETSDFLHKKQVHCGSNSPQYGAESEGIVTRFSASFTVTIAFFLKLNLLE